MDVEVTGCRERIVSEQYYDVITDYPLNRLEESGFDLCAADVDGQFHIVYINRRDVIDAGRYLFQYRSVPKLYGLMQPGEFDPNNLIASGILRAQGEPLNLTGRGVVVCFIDTGIDYTNPIFRDASGNSRILAIWDQTIQEGPSPKGFDYGTEYTREELNRALREDDPYSIVPSRDTQGHGTAMAGVAAGAGADYLGAAPEADIVVVKLKECKQYLREFYLLPSDVPAYQENDIMLGVQYADGFARQFNRPVVICLGLGTNSGDHEGNSALGEYLRAVAGRPSRAAVVAGGNEGNAGHHYVGQLGNYDSNIGRVDGAGIADNSQQDRVEIRVGENVKGFILELWGNVPDRFILSVRTPGGETVPAVRLGTGESVTYDFVYEKTILTVAGELVEPSSGEELILLRVQDPTPGIWVFQVEAVGAVYNGNFHMWLPITQFIGGAVNFLEPAPDTTLTEPGMSENVITVSTYDTANNSFYILSGRGFTRTGRVKPDFAAPGVEISIVRGTQTGSSLAAAITTGAVAQFMQWAVVENNDDAVSGREVKNYFIRGAARESDLFYPNREWGYGRLDVTGVFDNLVGI